MADGRDDGSIAPRRSLGGPILPPPPPELADHARKAEEEKAAAARAAQEKKAAREARDAEREQARREKAAQAEQRKAEKAAAAKAASEKAAADKAAREQAAKDKAAADRAAADKAAGERAARDKTSARQAGAQRNDQGAAPERTSERTQSTSAVRPSATSAAPGGATSTKAGRSDRKRSGPRRTRRAQLRLVQIDAWSVMKTSFLLSIALGIVLVVAVAIIWSVLGAAGVWDSINSIVQQAVGSEQGEPFDIEKYVGTSRILGLTSLVAVFDVVLITAISTLGAFLYNLSAALLGGIEVTLAEDN